MAKTKTKTIPRDAGNGRIVTKKYATRNPGKTVIEKRKICK